jgi:hypothetical protein
MSIPVDCMGLDAGIGVWLVGVVFKAQRSRVENWKDHNRPLKAHCRIKATDT